MDRYGWIKSTTQFSTLCSAPTINNQTIFFNVNDIHLDEHALRYTEYQNIQHFPPKAGKSWNDQPNDYGTNEKLKSFYNDAKKFWMIKYVETKVLPHHMY